MTSQTLIDFPSQIEALDQAKHLDSRIREHGRSSNELQARIANLLLELDERGGALLLGYADIGAYGRAALDYSQRKTRDLVTTARRLRSQPLLREEFEKGAIEWTKARTAAAAVELDPGNEASWRDRALSLSSRQLEIEAAHARGEDPKEWLMLTLTPEELADINDAIQAIRQERRGEAVTNEAALAEICRRAVKHGSEPVGGPSHRVVINVCADCWKRSREGSEGPIPVAPAHAEAMACDSELLDVRHGPARLRRTIPRRIANFIEGRDRGRCRVPECRNRAYLERHHEGGFLQVGHDPGRMFLLCDDHHISRHQGRITVKIADGVAWFFRLDGVCLGDGFRLDNGLPVPCSRGQVIHTTEPSRSTAGSDPP